MRRLLPLLLCAACGDSSSQAAAQGGAVKRGMASRFPVDVARVESRRVEYVINAVGSIDAFEKVQVTARVGGAVDRVLFQEGDTVKPGQALAEVEPQRYQIAVDTARAALAKAQSALADAKAGVQRRESAVAQSPGLIPGEEVETFRTRMHGAEADMAAARAALQLAELNLRDAYVRAPAAGIIETRTVQTGQYLQPGAVLATLVRREPLLLRFQVPEPDAQKLTPGMAARFRVRSEETEYKAALSHVGGAAVEASRMVLVTATIDEESGRRLRPGAFAEVAVPVGGQTDAPVIPQVAVRPSERGFLAYVVENDVAKERVLQLGMRTADGRVEVREGIKAGEMLVVRGAEALREGAPVHVTGKP